MCKIMGNSILTYVELQIFKFGKGIHKKLIQNLLFFPIKKNKHKMTKRKNEKFIVNYARTERLRTSSIPYMQRLLNRNHQEYQIKLHY